ncbi:gp93-like protein [Phenacoccus solenopsis nudivirus]|nr:gp93-like protein [Phenacoccus solenopsis nudivirus]
MDSDTTSVIMDRLEDERFINILRRNVKQIRPNIVQKQNETATSRRKIQNLSNTAMRDGESSLSIVVDNQNITEHLSTRNNNAATVSSVVGAINRVNRTNDESSMMPPPRIIPAPRLPTTRKRKLSNQNSVFSSMSVPDPRRLLVDDTSKHQYHHRQQQRIDNSTINHNDNNIVFVDDDNNVYDDDNNDNDEPPPDEQSVLTREFALPQLHHRQPSTTSTSQNYDDVTETAAMITAPSTASNANTHHQHFQQPTIAPPPLTYLMPRNVIVDGYSMQSHRFICCLHTRGECFIEFVNGIQYHIIPIKNSKEISPYSMNRYNKPPACKRNLKETMNEFWEQLTSVPGQPPMMCPYDKHVMCGTLDYLMKMYKTILYEILYLNCEKFSKQNKHLDLIHLHVVTDGFGNFALSNKHLLVENKIPASMTTTNATLSKTKNSINDRIRYYVSYSFLKGIVKELSMLKYVELSAETLNWVRSLNPNANKQAKNRITDTTCVQCRGHVALS